MMLHRWDGSGQVSSAWFPQHMTLRIEAKQFHLGFIRPEHLVSHSSSPLRSKLQTGFPVSFAEERRPSGHSPIKPRLMECCSYVVLLEVPPISTPNGWGSARVTIGFLVTSLAQAHLPRLFSLARQPALAIVLGAPNFHLHNPL